MTQYTLSLTILGKDKVSGMFNRIDRSLRSIMQTAVGMTLARIFEDAAEALFKLATQALNAVAFVQVLQITLGSLAARELAQFSDGLLTVADVGEDAAEMAAELVHELGRVAILSPYTLEATTNTYRMMVAFGSTTLQAMDLTKSLLLMGAGLGASNEQIQRMGYNLAQIALQGSVTKLDIRQLALAGLDLLDVLQAVGDKFGYEIETHKDFNALLDEGKISWQDFVDTFKEKAETDFAGASEKMARSLYGLSSTLKDVFTLTIPQILGPAADEIGVLVGKILDTFLFLYEDPRLGEIGASLAESVKKGIAPFNAVIDTLNYNLARGVPIAEAFGTALDQLVPMITRRILGLRDEIVTAIPTITDKVADLMSGIIDAVIAALPGLISSASTIVQAFVDAFIKHVPGMLLKVADAIATIGIILHGAIPDIMTNLANAFIAALPRLNTVIVMIVSTANRAFSTFATSLKKELPRVAKELVKQTSYLLESMTEQLPGFIDTITDIITLLANEFSTAAETLIPQVVDLALAIAGAFADNLPELLDAGLQIIEGIGQGITDSLPALTDTGSEILTSIVDSVLEALETGIEILAPLLQAISDSLTQDEGGLSETGITLVERIMTAIIDNIGLLIELGIPIVTTLIDGILGATSTWVQRMPELLTTIVDQLVALAPMMIDAALPLMTTFIVGLATIIPQLYPAIAEVILAIQEALIVHAPLVAEAGVEIMLAVLDAMIENPELITESVLAVVRFLTESFIRFPGLIMAAAQEIISILLSGLLISAVKLLTNIPEIGNAISDAVNASVETFMEAGAGAVEGILEGMLGYPAGSLKGKIKEVTQRMIHDFQNGIKDFKGIGEDLIAGLYQGMVDKWDELKFKFRKLAAMIVALFELITDTNSPSGVFMELGKNLMEGLAIGIKDSMKLPGLALAEANLALSGQVGGTSTQQGTTIKNFYLSMQTSSNPLDVITVFELAEAWGGT